MTQEENWRLEALWEGVEAASPWRVYALLDGARDDRIRPRVLASDLPHVCLYSGAVAPELAETAPYLVQLAKDAVFTRDLLRDAWGDAWGLFVLSTGSLEDLRRHFRRLLRVTDSRGRRLLFRFYDPRVLRDYLPTCRVGELRAMFGPVGFFMVEGEDGSMLLRYHRTDDGLEQREMPIEALKAASSQPGAPTCS